MENGKNNWHWVRFKRCPRDELSCAGCGKRDGADEAGVVCAVCGCLRWLYMLMALWNVTDRVSVRLSADWMDGLTLLEMALSKPKQIWVWKRTGWGWWERGGGGDASGKHLPSSRCSRDLWILALIPRRWVILIRPSRPTHHLWMQISNN